MPYQMKVTKTLRNFTLLEPFTIGTATKLIDADFHFPLPVPCNVVPLFGRRVENNKHPKCEWRGEGRGVEWNVLFSYVIPFEENA